MPQRGKRSAIRSMPSKVHIASLRSSSLPVQIVNVSGSNSRSCSGTPYLPQASWCRRVAISSFRSGDFAMPSSSMVKAISAALCCFAKGQRVSILCSPSSKLMELMIALPPTSLSAASTTGFSVESMTMGAATEPRRRLMASVMSATSSRPT
jgi:hypothetical protein